MGGRMQNPDPGFDKSRTKRLLDGASRPQGKPQDVANQSRHSRHHQTLVDINIPLRERELLFGVRRRPRRKGKPVL